jgi:hypothetical protein
LRLEGACVFLVSNFCHAHAPNSNTIYDKNKRKTRSKQKAAIVALEMHLSGAWSLQSCFALETEKNGENNEKF